MTTSSESTNDTVTIGLVQARLALGTGEDPHLADMIDAALSHRAAAITSGTPPSFAPAPDKRIIRALAFINANLDDNQITLARIAAAAGMSQFHFSRVFTSVTGHPPRFYLLNQRLALARKLLCSPSHQSMQIVEVALTCGFVSQSHFTCEFRRRFGCPPLQWRRRAAQQQGQRSVDATTLKEASVQ